MSVFGDSFFNPFPFSRLALPLSDWDDSSKDTSAVANRPASFFSASNFFQGPRIDIHEHPDHYSLQAELAGAKKSDIKVSVDSASRKLTLSGEVRSEYTSPSIAATNNAAEVAKGAKEGTETAAAQAQAQSEKDVSVTKGKASKDYHSHHGPRPLITERMYGTFSRSFILPRDADLESEHVKGKFDNGVLLLTIPKREQQKRQVRNVTIEDVAE
ncbi:hypothetical protein OC834_005058 [Tilletia horrida]|nr:hypothetical protein OC834_005058 [Tilletia horrida]